MTSYCQYNDAFSNTENDNLDNLARQLNNKHKKLNKITNDGFKNQFDTNYSGVKCLADPSNSRFAPPNLENDFSFFSAQGDFSSGLPTPFEKQFNKKKKKYYKDSDSSNYTDNNSIESFGSVSSPKKNLSEEFGSSIAKIESDISSNYSSLPPKIKKQLRLNTPHLKKYDDNDDKTVIKHMKECKQCQAQINEQINNQLMNIINPMMHNNSIVTQNPGIMNFNSPELKDTLILVLIGIFIIIIFDVFFRR